jgi:murein DD-endopeptidase MepM/ murein hydrolase activator NlpD
MKFSILILTSSLFFSTYCIAQQSVPDTIVSKTPVSEMDSLLNTIEEIQEDSIKSIDEVLYKNNWSSTQIKYPANTLPPKTDTITISLRGTGNLKFIAPTKGPVISKFGPRRGRMHSGTDIRINSGDTIRSAFDGKVRLAKRFSGYGNLVLVRHNNGLETIYGHLKTIKVKLNDSIKAGDLIGLGGRTGRATCNHLHFETRLFGQAFDSNKYIDFETYTLRTDKIYYANKRFEVDLANFKKKPSPADGLEFAEGGARKHVIRKGDNLSTIARKYQTSVRKICAANNITAQTTLKIGRVLKIN